MTGKELSSYAWVPFPRFWQNTNIPRVDHWCYGVKNYGVAIPVTLKYLRTERWKFVNVNGSGSPKRASLRGTHFQEKEDCV